MESISSVLLKVHIAAGFTSLILFWIPVFTKKGGINHTKIGRWYVYAMWIVVLSAALLSVKNFLIGNAVTGSFLGYLTVITMNPLWYGIAILNHKKSIGEWYRRGHYFFNILVFVSGIMLVGYGLILEEGVRILMIFFGLLGVNTGRAIIKDFRNGVKANWFQTHYSGMIVSGIAAYTAFFAFGGRKFLAEILPGYWQVLPWILPTVIGLLVIKWMDRKYFPKSKPHEISA